MKNTTRIKTKNQKTIIFALLLVLLLSVCCLLFAGCSMFGSNDSDDNGGSSDGNGGSGGSGGSSGSGNHQSVELVSNKFKLGYRGTDTDEEAKNNISELSKAFVEDFATTFGAGKGFGENKNIYYYDSIRYQAYDVENDDYEDETERWSAWFNKANRWKWSFANGSNPLGWGCADHRWKEVYFYTVDKHHLYVSGEYQTFYSNLYFEAMEVVLYEILLGRTDYQNMIVIDDEFDSNGYPQISYRGQSVAITGGKPNFDAILSDLQAEYFDKTTYFGFSLDDAKKIEDYIINYVIGSKALSDKDGNDQLNSNRNYRAYVEQLVDGKINSKTKYYWYARTEYKDGSLAISSTEDYFLLAPKAEYQSLVLMADEQDEFSTCWIAFQSERDLKINMYYRYFDGQTVKTTAPKTVNVKGGAYNLISNNSSYMNFGVDNGYFAIGIFDNNDVVAAPTARLNDSAANIYNPISSKNGFGCVSVFNENNVNSSFIEIVLDVEKNANDPIGTDYSFQVAMFRLTFKSNIDD